MSPSYNWCNNDITDCLDILNLQSLGKILKLEAYLNLKNDSDLQLRAKVIKWFFNQNTISKSNWALQSLDLNPIEEL